MSKHDDDTCPHLVRASLLEAENARLKAEVKRLRSQFANSEWQPIKTAPKDGTAVLIYCQVSGAMESHWDCEWLDRHNDCCDIYEVTHWTQLPNPPPAKEGNDCLGQMHDKEMERSAYLL